MKKTIKVMLLGLIVSATTVGCQKDDTPSFEKKTVENVELLTALKAKGFKTEGNAIVLNDVVKKTDRLDLSGIKLKSLKGLEIFPALEGVDLSNNALEEIDFALLPKTVKAVELQGNPTKVLKNLKVDRKFTRLFLPSVAQFDMGDILAYYKANKGLNMQYEKDGKLVKYTLLRDVVDDNMRAELKKSFPSVFTGEQVDLSKPMSEEDSKKNFELGSEFSTYDKEVSSLDGVQFIISRDEYKGNFIIKLDKKAPISYYKAPKNVKEQAFKNVIAQGVFDLSTAINATNITLIKIDNLKDVDLSENVALGDFTNAHNGSDLQLVKCPDLETVEMPKNWDKKEQIDFSATLYSLDKFKGIDLTQVQRSATNRSYILGLLPESCKILYPKNFHKKIIYPELIKNPTEENLMNTFMVTNDFKERKDFKAFVEANKSIILISEAQKMMMDWLY